MQENGGAPATASAAYEAGNDVVTLNNPTGGGDSNGSSLAQTKKQEPVYSDEELSIFSTIIKQKKDQAEALLKTIREDIKEHEGSKPTGDGIAEDTKHWRNHLQQLTTDRQRQVEYIANLDRATIRIDNKTYGICFTTGKRIPMERLLLVPHATTSVEGKIIRNSRAN